MVRHGTGLLAAALCGLVTLLPSVASAQPPPGPTPGATPGATPATPPPVTPKTGSDSADPVDRARVHYERGLQLFNEENYEAALFEFERAYELAPSYKILYNMARIQRQQNNYAAALRSY